MNTIQNKHCLFTTSGPPLINTFLVTIDEKDRYNKIADVVVKKPKHKDRLDIIAINGTRVGLWKIFNLLSKRLHLFKHKYDLW